MTSKFDCDPCGKGGIFSKVKARSNDIESILESFEGTYPISYEISCLILGDMILDNTVLYQSNNTAKKNIYYEEIHCTVVSVKSKSSPSFIPDKLSRMWGIGFNTEIYLRRKNPSFFRYTGLLEKRFKTYKAQIRYKQISCRYVTFYVEYLKVVVKSVRQSIGGTLYTNKIGFNKFLPCSNETSE